MSESPGPERPIVNPDIEKYIESFSPPEDEVQRDMEEYARINDFPIIGPAVGRLLYQLTVISGAERIIELGSGFGYSAYWFGKALGGRGRITFTDMSEENAELAEGFLKRAGVMDNVDIVVGDALEILDGTEGPFDIIFNDVDKEQYPASVPKAYAKLKKGGIFIADNILWHGRVLSDDDSHGTGGVKEFTRLLYAERGFYNTVLPVRDGVSISLKL